MRAITRKMLAVVVCCLLACGQAEAVRTLVPVGRAVGLQVRTGTVTVAGFDDALASPARKAGLQVGDVLLSVNGTQVHTGAEVQSALEHSDGTVELEVERSGKQRSIRLHPAATSAGPRLGVYIREGMTGIGTVTWYDPETGCFGALGHGINGSDGALLPMENGVVYEAEVTAVKKGKSGQPGQLQGSVGSGSTLGVLEKNTAFGVFGKTEVGWRGEALPVAESGEVKTGPAVVRANLSGDTVGEYRVEILKIYPGQDAQGRNLLLRVTDPTLLELTGGVVQGMSGSPILQNGKLVGAVTHVLVNDPTTGYGILMENMLDGAA